LLQNIFIFIINMQKAVIVIPTYNERENIIELITTIHSAVKDVKDYEVKMLFVDDSSPDGTGELIAAIAKHDDAVKLLSRNSKEGLGKAYVAGFKYAINNMYAEVVFEMDADLSHDPALIPLFLEEINDGSDFVIGSRYINGGSIPEKWTTFRKLNSKVANIFARYVAGLSDVRDCTSGYRAIHTAILKRLNLNALGAKGYAFQMNLLYACLLNGARVSEIPLKFVDRVNGKSKLRFVDIQEFVVNAIKLRMPVREPSRRLVLDI
jgi:dolichol-phosphate mannosyltransferase